MAEAAKRSRPTLYGVSGTENTVKLVDIGIIEVQIQKQLLHIGKQFVRFVEERIEKLAQVHACTHGRFPLHILITQCYPVCPAIFSRIGGYADVRDNGFHELSTAPRDQGKVEAR